MSGTKFIVAFIAILCLLMVSHSPLHAAGKKALPDELTLNVGDVKNVGKDVTLVLKKRSMRSDTYLCGVWSDNGFKKLDSPVTTYRGYVKGDPAMRVNANIGPVVVAHRIVHGSIQHLELLLGPVVVTILSIVDESFIIPACP